MCFLAMGSVYALHGAATRASHHPPRWHGLWSNAAVSVTLSGLGTTGRRKLLWPVLQTPRWMRRDS